MKSTMACCSRSPADLPARDPIASHSRDKPAPRQFEPSGHDRLLFSFRTSALDIVMALIDRGPLGS